MSVEKINQALSIRFGNTPEAPKQNIKPTNEVDEEKSLSMAAKVGLCAAAAVAIGGIILYARKGKSSKLPGGGGSTASSTTSTTSSSNSSSSGPVFEPVKNFMKKLEDGTEYLFRTEERDKDGNLLKSIRYAKDGKTVERVREFKMTPVGVTDSARNVVTSEIRYDKNGNIVYKRLANEGFSGYTIERSVDEGAHWAKVSYSEKCEGSRYRATAYLGEIFDAKTGLKRYEAEFGPQGTDDMKFYRTFDKKTGTKVVQKMEKLSEDTYKATMFGEGKSKRVSVFRKIDGQEDELVKFEQFDSKGRLRVSHEKQGDKEIIKKIDKKGREFIVEKVPGFDDIVRRAYTKNEHRYIETFERDGGISLYRDEVAIGDIKRAYAPNQAKFTFPNYVLTYDEAGNKVSKIFYNDNCENRTILYDKLGNWKSCTEKDASNKVVYNAWYRGNFRLATEIDDEKKVVTLSRRSKENPHWWTNVKQTTYNSDGAKEMRNMRKGGTSLHFQDNPRIRKWDAQGRVIEYDGSEFGYIRNIITETNNAEGFRIVYENDFNNPVEKYLKNEKGEWEKAPLEF